MLSNELPPQHSCVRFFPPSNTASPTPERYENDQVRPREALGIYQIVLVLEEMQYGSIEEEEALQDWHFIQRCESLVWGSREIVLWIAEQHRRTM